MFGRPLIYLNSKGESNRTPGTRLALISPQPIKDGPHAGQGLEENTGQRRAGKRLMEG